MRFAQVLGFAVVATISLMYSGPSLAAIVINEFSNQASVREGNALSPPEDIAAQNSVTDTGNETSLPSTVEANLDGDSRSAFALSNISATSSNITITPELKRNWTISSNPTHHNDAGVYSQVVFAVDVDSTYSIAGSFTTGDVVDLTQYEAWLSPVTALGDYSGPDLFYQSQGSETASPDTTYTLSGSGLTGTLVAGQLYEFGVWAYSWGSQFSGTPTLSSAGFATLNVTPVPEPSAFLVGCLIVGLAVTTWAAGGRKLIMSALAE